MLFNSPQLQSEPTSQNKKGLDPLILLREEEKLEPKILDKKNRYQKISFDEEQKAMEVFLNKDNQFPNEFYCPISLDIMKDPVMADDGRTYERSAIESWLKHKKVSPFDTNKKITKLTTNYALKNIIEDKLSDYYGTNNSDNIDKSQSHKPAKKLMSFFIAKEDIRRFFARDLVSFITDIQDYLRLHASHIKLEKNIEFKIAKNTLSLLSNSSNVESLSNADIQINSTIKEKLTSYIKLCIARHPNLNYAKDDEEYCDIITDLLNDNNINGIKEKGGMAIEENNKNTGFCSWFHFTS